MNQNDRRVVRTKKAIRAAFLSLLEEQDFAKVTIAGIARAPISTARRSICTTNQSMRSLTS